MPFKLNIIDYHTITHLFPLCKDWCKFVTTRLQKDSRAADNN